MVDRLVSGTSAQLRAYGFDSHFWHHLETAEAVLPKKMKVFYNTSLVVCDFADYLLF